MEEEEENISSEIEKIKGVGPAIANKLRESGFSTIESIAVATAAELAASVEIGESTARKIIKAAQSLLKIQFMTAKELLDKRRAIYKITTGSSNLDNILGGGIETRGITEFFGEYATGKTQICHQLSVTVQLPQDKGGLNAGAVYIDTEGTFRPERIEQMALSLNLDPEKTLSNIIYGRAYSTDHQLFLVKNLDEVITSSNIKLVIIDSIVSHFRSEFPGRESLVKRQQKLNKHLHDLLRLSDIYDCAVVVTNQVIARPDVFYGNPLIPAGGNIVAHTVTTRVFLTKRKENLRAAKIVDSPILPSSETLFKITEEGVRDAE